MNPEAVSFCEPVYMPLVVGECPLPHRLERRHLGMTIEQLRDACALPRALIAQIEEYTGGQFPPKLDPVKNPGKTIVQFIADRNTGITSAPVADRAIDTLGSMAVRAGEDAAAKLARAGLKLGKEPLVVALSTSCCKDPHGEHPKCTDHQRLRELGEEVTDALCKNLGICRDHVMHVITLDHACAGFVGIIDETRKAMERLPDVHHAMMIATEILTDVVDWKDPLSYFLFRDGAYAAALTRDPLTSVRSLRLKGSYHHHDDSPEAQNSLYFEDNRMKLDGKRVFQAAVKQMYEAVEVLARHCGRTIKDISHTWFHQANGRILEALKERLTKVHPGINVPIEMEKGNGGSITLLSLIQTLTEKGELAKLKIDELVMLVAFGMGTHNRAVLGQLV